MVVTAALLTMLAANPYLAEGRERFQQLQYERALNPLTLAAQVPGQTQSERREAFDLLARTRAALGDLAGATRAYRELLERDSAAPAPSEAAPKIREAFRAAKVDLFPAGTVKLTRVAAPEGHLGFELFDPWGAVARLEVHELGGPRTFTARPDPLVDIRLPSSVAQAWVEALNTAGATIGTLGSPRLPLRLPRAPAAAASPVKPKPDDEGPVLVGREGILRSLRAEACAAAKAGDPVRTETAWRRGLSLEPNLASPDECKVAMPSYLAALEWSRAHPPLTVEIAAERTASGGTRLTLQPRNDTLGLVQSARFHLRAGESWSDQLGLTIDHPGRVDGYWVEATGEAGVLLTVGSASEPLVPALRGDAPVARVLTPGEPASVVSAVKRWRLPVAVSGAGLTVIAAALGLGFGIAARSDAATLSGLTSMGTITELTQREAFGLASRQRSEATIANVALGVAAGLAVTTFLLFVLSAEPAP